MSRGTPEFYKCQTLQNIKAHSAVKIGLLQFQVPSNETIIYSMDDGGHFQLYEFNKSSQLFKKMMKDEAKVKGEPLFMLQGGQEILVKSENQLGL